MPHRRGAGGGMTDADFRKLQLDYYKNNPKAGALPFKDFLKEVKNDQEIREAVSSDRHDVPRSHRHRASDLKKGEATREAVSSGRHKNPKSHLHHASDLSKKEQAIRETVSSNHPKVPRSHHHRTSDLSGHDHHLHGSESARPHVSPRVGARSKHNTPSAHGMGDHHGMPGLAFKNEPLLPRQRGDLRGTGAHDRDGIFEDRRPSSRLGGHHDTGRHARQAEGLHQHTIAEDLGRMHLGDQGHHGRRSEPHGFGSRTGREELPPRRGHHGGRPVRGPDVQPLGIRRATPAPLSSRHQKASSRPQHSRTQEERHHTRHGDFSQHPGFQGSQGGRGGREDSFW
ncbi:hypothetical protein BDR22DRAFT_826488 [Usnea florida]